MSREAFESGRVRQKAQDGSREFISLLACVSAIGAFLPPTLIYKGEGFDLQTSWIEDLEDSDMAYFGSSSNGWSNDDFGLQWLVQVFDRHTRRLSGNRRRLLIVDGHSSHVNMRFLNKCDELRILVLILPPHSTHRLQPLDVGLFQPLSTFYSQEVDQLMTKSLGEVSMSKRKFWSLFKSAFLKAFSQENIQSAFRKAGIWPTDNTIVLHAITQPSTPPQTQIKLVQRLKTPLTSKSIRQFHISYRRSPTKEKLQKLFKANERLAAQHSVDEHTKKGLVDALKDEKKKRKRGKKLGVADPALQSAQLFSPTTIKHAQEAQASKALELEAEKARIASNKATALANKAKIQAEKVERAIQRDLAKQAKAQIDAEKRAQKEVEKQTKLTKKLASKPSIKKKVIVKKPKRVTTIQKKVVETKEVVLERVGPNAGVQMTSKGRCRKIPQRYIQ